MPLYVFYTMVQKSQKWPKTQIKGGGSCLNELEKKHCKPDFAFHEQRCHWWVSESLRSSDMTTKLLHHRSVMHCGVYQGQFSWWLCNSQCMKLQQQNKFVVLVCTVDPVQSSFWAEHFLRTIKDWIKIGKWKRTGYSKMFCELTWN